MQGNSLIDITPSTILTTMHGAEKITQKAHNYTFDARSVTLENSTGSDVVRYFKIYPYEQANEPMSWLMSYVTFIGVLMGNNGVIPWLECAFTGVPNMLIDKNFPMNISALRITCWNS